MRPEQEVSRGHGIRSSWPSPDHIETTRKPSQRTGTARERAGLTAQMIDAKKITAIFPISVT